VEFDLAQFIFGGHVVAESVGELALGVDFKDQDDEDRR